MKQEHSEQLAGKILTELRQLNHELHEGNSLKNKLLQGIMVGLGTFLGATVIVGLLIFILTRLATVEALKPFIQSIVEIVQSTDKS